MLTPKQTRLFEVFLRSPYKQVTYRDIKEYSKEKSNSIIQKAISKFLEEGLVQKKAVGNIILYSLDLANNLVHSYFTILIEKKLPKSAKLCLKNIIEELSRLHFVSMAVFGSYAESIHTGKSDLDIALFVSSEADKRDCELSVKAAQFKAVTHIDAHVFTKDEMLQMLKDKQENLGKQIAKKHLAVHNPAIFYSIIQEGIDNGFQVVYQ